jgi:dTMP kinase
MLWKQEGDRSVKWMKKSHLICFTGVDGSGKTSHAKALLGYLETKGYACKYVWGASRPVFSYLFFAFARVFGFWKETKKDAYTDPLEYADRRLIKILAPVWHLFLFVDFQLRTSFRIRYSLMSGKTVVCDRYFYDMLTDLSVTEKSSDEFASLISRTVPTPAIGFLLDAPENVTGGRRPISMQELHAKRMTFLAIAKVFDLIRIDSSQDFSANQQRIRALTLAKIGRGCTGFKTGTGAASQS